MSALILPIFSGNTLNLEASDSLVRLLTCPDPPNKAKVLHKLVLYMLSSVLFKVFHAYKYILPVFKSAGGKDCDLYFFLLMFLPPLIIVTFVSLTLLRNLEDRDNS